MRRIFAGMGVLGVAALAMTGTATASPQGAGGTMTICHATGSELNPYVAVTISVDAINGPNDHLGSHHDEDIIPPNNGSILPGGRNLDKIDWWEAGCKDPRSLTDPVVEVPVELDPVVEVPVESDPVVEVPVEPGPVVEVPVESGPVVEVPVEPGPVVEVPVESDPVVEVPVESDPVVGVPVELDPVVGVPVELDPVVGVPVELDPVVEVPVELDPVVEVPASPVSGQMPSTERVPTSAGLAQASQQSASGGSGARNKGYGVQTAAAAAPSDAPWMTGLAAMLLSCLAVAVRTAPRHTRRHPVGM